MQDNNNEEVEIDLKELFYVIYHKLWVIILAGLIGACVFGVYSATLIKPTYTSSTMMYIVNKTTTLTSLTDLQLGTQLTKDYMVLVKSRPVTQKVIENLGLNMSHEALVRKVSVDNPTDTRILTISVTDTDPYIAKAIADEFATVSSARMAEIMDTTPPNIVEEAYLPTQKTAPSISKNTVIGGLLGGFLAAFIVVVAFILNDSIKTAEDVERYLNLNVLGMIPIDEDQKSRKKKSGRKNKKKRG